MLLPYVAWLGSFALFDWLLRGAGGFGSLAALVLSVMVWTWLGGRRSNKTR